MNPAIPGIGRRTGEGNWSRREELNTPSAKYNSAALALSYTGVDKMILRERFA